MSWYPPRSGPPRRVDDGLKVKGRSGQIGEKWWSRRWVEALEAIADASRLQRGRRYARSGQVMDLEPAAGGLVARVQGSRAKPYKVVIAVDRLSDDGWEQVFDALAQRASHTAALLAGDVPREVIEVFASLGLPLLPQSEDDLETDCTCPDWANPCKHVAATHYVVAEALDEDPFLLFALRGRGRAEVLAALRARRGSLTPAEAPVVLAKTHVGPARPFYGVARNVPVKVRMRSDADPTTFLKALGPPPVFASSTTPKGLLETVYRKTAAHAERIVHGADHDGPPAVPTNGAARRPSNGTTRMKGR